MNQDYSHLQMPVSLYEQKPKIAQALYESKGKIKRRFFYNVPFTINQLNQMKKFKQYAYQKNKNISCQKQDILRYLHATQFNFIDCLNKIEIFLQWIHNPAIQNVNQKTLKILKNGVIYTFGRDRNNRPIIYLNLAQINLKIYSLNEYYSAINAVLTVVTQFLFVKGVVETYVFIIDMGGKNFTSLPFDGILNIVKKLSIVYSMYLGSMLIINANKFVKITYFTVKKFLHEETVNKIQIFSCDEIQGIKNFISQDQLQKKHCGALDNLPVYWPPRIPTELSGDRTEEETVYYSVQDQNSVFLEKNGLQNEGYCCSRNDCSIF